MAERETFAQRAGASVSGRRSSIFVLIILIVLLALSLVLSLAFGAEPLSLGLFFGGGDRFERIIFYDLRLPRSLLVLVTGILLGGSGAVFQLFFRNPLAEPGIMGISAGATLGAVSAGVLGLGAGLGAGAGVGTVGAGAVSAAGVAAGGVAAGGLASLLRFISPINLFAFLGALAMIITAPCILIL